MTTNKVYTYYHQIDSIDNDTDRNCSQNTLIDICKQSWEINGWEFNILSYDDAKKHPFYNEYSSKISILPSINPAGYDYHCYMRWLAMAHIGGGIMIDYDVINLSLKDSSIFLKQNTLSIYQGHVPCVVYGTADQYLEVCQAFCEPLTFTHLIGDQPHVSDMLIIAKTNKFNDNTKYKKILYVSDYPQIAPLVHCSQVHCSKQNIKKIQAMQTILDNIKYDI